MCVGNEYAYTARRGEFYSLAHIFVRRSCVGMLTGTVSISLTCLHVFKVGQISNNFRRRGGFRLGS